MTRTGILVTYPAPPATGAWPSDRWRLRRRVHGGGEDEVLPGHARALEQPGALRLGGHIAADELRQPHERSGVEGARLDGGDDVARLAQRARARLDDHRGAAGEPLVDLARGGLVGADGDHHGLV